MPATSSRLDLPPRYRVLRHVATGGMAAVYAAQDELLGREVAVKVLAEALGADDDARRRFTREARAAARVSDHPNVVTIYDIAESDGDPPIAFIVMELLTGGTVADRLRAGDAIPHTLALRWLEETAGALDAAHRTGMVHRDVKPANLLLDAHGTLKVADFGIATIANDVPLTRTGQVIGTAAYLSPEQAEGRPATDASDRYALAVVAFELLTGRRPFTADTPAAQAIAHVGTEPPAATAVAPGLPDAVDAVLARGLAKDPAERPVSAAALVSELHAALGPTATTGVAHPTPTEATAVAAAAPMQRLPQRPRTPRTPMPAAPPRTQPHTPRNRARVIGVAAALLVVAGAAIAAVAGSGSDKPVAARSAVDHRAPTAAKQHKPAAKPKAPAATTAAPATTTPAATGAPADAASIQADAHQKILNGDYNGAIGELQGLINRCDVAITDPCAFSWFDLGYALRRAGDPQDAVPVLEHRLQNSNQAGTVQAELDAARAEAAGGGPDKHHGKAKGHDKKDHH